MTEIRRATFSPCRIYRYTLEISWEAGDKVQFIGLNPSTADEVRDDQTIRRCKRFAKDWGYAGIVMTNLFAFRATNPRHMMMTPDPIGPGNDNAIMSVARESALTVACWGTRGSHRFRDAAVMALLGDQKMSCLGTTDRGHPRHPLYLPVHTELVSFP